MQFITLAAAALFSASAFAQQNVSRPFNLTVTSTNGKYSKTLLTSCHEGAAIEGLCIGYSGSTFHHNYTAGQTNTNGNGPEGPLTYLLPIGGQGSTQGTSEPMTLFADPSTNVALPLFEPASSGQGVAFDKQNLMNIPSNLDDTVTPPKAGNVSKALYRWYVCESNFEGYVYETLNWVYGKADPQNPSCVKVDVKRVFV